jgi:hypothetical protein
MMKSRLGFALVMLLILLASALPAAGVAAMPGGITETSIQDPWVMEAAAFAVRAQERAMREKGEEPSVKIALVRILGASRQVVAGMNYYLIIKVAVNEQEREADVVIWRQLSGGHELTSWKWR